MANKGMVAVAVGGLLDGRLSKEDRSFNLRYLQAKWVKGLLGNVGNWVWQQVVEYLNTYKEAMSFAELRPMLDGISEKDAEIVIYCEEYTQNENPCTTSQFKHAVKYLERENNQERFLNCLSRTMTIYQEGVKVRGKPVKGFVAAKKYLVESLRKIEEKGSSDGFVNLRDVEEILIESESGQVARNNILFGFDCIDELTGGGQFGELCLVESFANEGKSMFLVNVVWNAVVNHRKNVIVYNGEMTEKQYKRRLICRHSHHPKFELKGGLVYDDVKFGRLEASEKAKLEEVARDFSKNPDYGKLFIHGLNKEDNAVNIWQSVEALGTLRADMVAVDYLALVPPYQKRHFRREELSETIRMFKNFAQNAFSGEGIFLLCAYQANRAGRERAAEQGYYDLQSLEESAEAEKASDVIVWLLQTPELEEQNEVKVGISKSRDSAKLTEAYLYAEYASCYLGNISS
ncbi:MAG TPA: hypothetical protein ENH85_12940 [Candidatus Scalindua sp.]|nr:hypothetical protein [Candidatus Scalindua sp.]